MLSICRYMNVYRAVSLLLYLAWDGLSRRHGGKCQNSQWRKESRRHYTPSQQPMRHRA